MFSGELKTRNIFPLPSVQTVYIVFFMLLCTVMLSAQIHPGYSFSHAAHNNNNSSNVQNEVSSQNTKLYKNKLCSIPNDIISSVIA